MLKFWILGFLFLLALVKNAIYKFGNFNQTDDLSFLIHTVEGLVGKENFTYYSLHEEGPIKIVLESTNGDADLYVSSLKKPLFHPESYDFASATCGIDVVEITENMKKPIIIGIYGHPSYEESKFKISMYLMFKDTSEQNAEAPKSHKIKFGQLLKTWGVTELLESLFMFL